MIFNMRNGNFEFCVLVRELWTIGLTHHSLNTTHKHLMIAGGGGRRRSRIEAASLYHQVDNTSFPGNQEVVPQTSRGI
jgi:hypothetical protein